MVVPSAVQTFILIVATCLSHESVLATECTSVHNDDTSIVTDCRSRSLTGIPSNLPNHTHYLDLSKNLFKSFPNSQTLSNLIHLQVLDLTENPIACDCQLYKFWSTLKLKSVELKVTCRDPQTNQLQDTSTLINHLSPICANQKRRVFKRAVSQCSHSDSMTCTKYLCEDKEYWLLRASYWGCCNGTMHDLRQSFCSRNLGVVSCDYANSQGSDIFTCQNGHCIKRSWQCNSINDCRDGSDELGCGACNKTFLCRDQKTCISSSFVCDVYNDCGDGSDETFCLKANKVGWCAVSEFRCANDECIPLAGVCDGAGDCTDHSDEMGCSNSLACENGWQQQKSSCYKYSHDFRRWEDAKTQCQRYNANLVKIDSNHVQTFVAQIIGVQSDVVWIGASRQAYRSAWKWPDGTSFMSGYRAWGLGFPESQDLGKIRCVATRKSSTKWEDKDCEEHLPFVCQKALTCEPPCLNNGTCTANGCDCRPGFVGSNCAFDPPRITPLDKQDTSVDYGATLVLHCEAQGIPRPAVTWYINNVESQLVAGVVTQTGPYQANITITAKTNSDLTCIAVNRVGMDTAEIRISVEDDSSFIHLSLKLTEESFSDGLNDPLSNQFSELEARLSKMLSNVYKDAMVDGSLRRYDIVDLRTGSVVSDILLQIRDGKASEVERTLKGSINDEDYLDQFKVDPDAILFVSVKACVAEFFNVTWKSTFAGASVTHKCPNEAEGIAKRTCSDKGLWDYPDFTQCTNKEYLELKEKITMLSNSDFPSSSGITFIMKKLADLTKPNQRSSMLAGNLKVSEDILEDIVNYNKKFNLDAENSDDNVEYFFQIVSNVMEVDNKRDLKHLQRLDQTTTKLTLATDTYGMQAASGLEMRNVTSQFVVTRNLVAGTRVVYAETQGEDLKFPNYSSMQIISSSSWRGIGRDSITLPQTLFTKRAIDNRTKVVNFIYKTLGSLLTEGSSYDTVGLDFILGSRVVASSVFPVLVGPLQDHVVISFKDVSVIGKMPLCVYWNYTINSKGGGWSRDGCQLMSHDNTTVTCECNHLTNFAVLMDLSSGETFAEHRSPLQFITIIGCSISLIGLMVTLIIYFGFWRNLKSNKTTIHVNLCVALFVANVILLVGLDQTSNQAVCTAVSILLHYFFLCAVAWMLTEGIEIYNLVIKVFAGGSKKYYYLIGWGLPALIVGISLAVTGLEGYGGEKSCWLSVESGLIWAFIAPTLVVIGVNVIVFGLALRAMLKSHKVLEASEKEKVRLAFKCSAVLLPLLGVTWVFGVLGVSKDTVVFVYLFAIFNSLQGGLIFVFHCVLDHQVRSAIRSWARKRRHRFGTMYQSRTKSIDTKEASGSPGLTQRASGIELMDAQETPVNQGAVNTAITIQPKASGPKVRRSNGISSVD